MNVRPNCCDSTTSWKFKQVSLFCFCFLFFLLDLFSAFNATPQIRGPQNLQLEKACSLKLSKRPCLSVGLCVAGAVCDRAFGFIAGWLKLNYSVGTTEHTLREPKWLAQFLNGGGHPSPAPLPVFSISLGVGVLHLRGHTGVTSAHLNVKDSKEFGQIGHVKQKLLLYSTYCTHKRTLLQYCIFNI